MYSAIFLLRKHSACDSIDKIVVIFYNKTEHVLVRKEGHYEI